MRRMARWLPNAIQHLATALACLLLFTGWGAVTIALAEAVPSEGSLPTEADRCPFTGRFPVQIEVATPFELSALEAGEIDIDQFDGARVTAYVDDAAFADLESAGYRIQAIPNQARRAFLQFKADVDAGLRAPGREDYHTYESLTAELQQIASDHPDIAMLTSIGQSEEGRELWMLKLSDNVTEDEPEPAFKYTATIHGDEVVGMEMCVYLIRLLVENYGIDPDLTALVDDLEIWICPLHNPDGNAAGTRYNASGYDLNRNFPDPLEDPNDDPEGRPTEVQHMMIWQYDYNFTIGVNYHGGALVVNYPWDCFYGQYTPDHDQIHNLALGYSYRNPPMWNSGQFYQGVTIGWEWYVIHGGFQDWAYNWRNELHFCIELSNVKWPPAYQLPSFWDENRDAMLWLLAQARNGIEGVITDAATGNPVPATIDVGEIGKAIYNDAHGGFYHRMLEPGTYTLEIESYGYQPYTSSPLAVSEGVSTVHDVHLQRAGSWYDVSGVVNQAGTGQPLTGAMVAVYRSDTGELFLQVEADETTAQYTAEVPAGTYEIVASAPGHVSVTETQTVSGNQTLDFALPPARAEILVVSDENPTNIVTEDLTALGYRATRETIVTTQPATWGGYDLVFWSAGSYKNPLRMEGRREAMLSYVAGGGKLVVEGGEVAYDALSSPGYPEIASEVLHLSDYHTDNAGDLVLRTSQSDHPLATLPNALPSTLDVTYDYFGDQDAASPLADATVVYGTSSYPDGAGILVYDMPGRGEGQIVFLAIDYDALTDGALAGQLLENTVEYLLSSSQGVPDVLAGGRLHLSRPEPSLTSGETTLRLRMPSANEARVELFDAAGRRVRTLLLGVLDGGETAINWDGRDQRGHAVPTGIYFIRAQASGQEMTRRIVVVE